MPDEAFKIRTSHPPARKTEFIPHSHPELEIGFFKSGCGVYTVKNREYDIRTGDIFLFDSDELHKVTTVEATVPMHTFTVLFQPRLVWDSLTDDFSNDVLSAFRRCGQNGAHRIDSTHPAYETLAAYIADIEREWSAEKPFYRKLIKNRILDFLITLSRAVGEPTERVEVEDTSLRELLPIINACVDEIEERFCEDVSVRELAEKHGMSQNFFTRCFKQVNGIPPKAYISSKRVEKAIRLIRTTDMSILDVATHCGFNSSTSFHKTFTKITGKKPTEYRKNDE